MGFMSNSMAEYAQPLIDDTDGSQAQMQYALSLAQMCWNLALLAEHERGLLLAKIQETMEMDAEEFLAFTDAVIAPMIARHHQMFPKQAPQMATATPTERRGGKFPGTGRNHPCPCGSGKKYKKCCGV
jgi:uncharacterized protein YecA (UPF0149 family)